MFPRRIGRRSALQGLLATTLFPSGVALARTCDAQDLPVNRSSYDSGPLGMLALGRWNRIQFTDTKRGEGILELDPNRIAWDGYSESWVSTRMAPYRVRVTLKPVKKIEPFAGPKVEPILSPTSLYDVIPQDLPEGQTLEKLGLGNNLRMVFTGLPFGPFRLLSMSGEGRVDRVIPLEKSPGNRLPSAGAYDLLALRTAPLAGKFGRVSQIRISGVLSSGTAKMTLDTNAMSVTPYGDPGAMTMMFVPPVALKLVEKTDLDEETKKQVAVYTLEGSPQPLLLALPRTANGTPRLVTLEAEGKRATHFFTLEPDNTPAAPLMNATWGLSKITYSDGKTLTPQAGGACQIQFLPNGLLRGRIGRNLIATAYVAVENRLVIVPGATTRAAWTPNSIEADFAKDLSNVSSFQARGDELWLLLKADSGTIILKRTPDKR